MTDTQGGALMWTPELIEAELAEADRWKPGFQRVQPERWGSALTELRRLQGEVARLRAAGAARNEWVRKHCPGYGSCGIWSPTCKECPVYAHPLDPPTPARLAVEVAATVALANDPDCAGGVETGKDCDGKGVKP